MGTPRAQIMNAAGAGVRNSSFVLLAVAMHRRRLAGRLAKRGNDLIPSKSTEFSE
jgi:hypothetical protein